MAAGAVVSLSAWTHRNQGAGDANAPGGPTGTISNGFYLSTDTIIRNSDIFLAGNSNTNDVLEAGEEFNWGAPDLTIPAGTAPGDYYIGILVDDDSLVHESDETNNFVFTPLTVTAELVEPILFVSDRDDATNVRDVFVMDPDGSNQSNITNSSGVTEANPAWSPDGAKIVFERGDQNNAEIWIMDADGTNQVRLTNNSVFDGYPDWSPDGNKITFTSRANGGFFEIWVMDSDGANPTQLTNTDTAGGNLRSEWSPDGSEIAFDSGRDGGAFEIYVMDSDGTSQTRLTTNSVSDFRPTWSPSGTQIAFERNDPNFNIFVMDADGSNQTQLTTNAAIDADAAWSPGGGWIAFASNRTGHFDVFRISIDGATVVNLSGSAGLDREPAWKK